MPHKPSNKYYEYKRSIAAATPGAGELFEYLETKTQWLTSPASIRFHGSYEGGLVDHSTQVTEVALRLKAAYPLATPFDGRLAMVAMFHDVGKLGSYTRQSPRSKVWYYNEKQVRMPHAVRSLMVVSRFVELSEEEWQAIYGHNGQYVPENKSLAMHEEPLTLILHMADVVAAKFGA